MNVRFSSLRNTMVYEKITRKPIGTVYDVLIHPDERTIEGFFISVSTLTGYSTGFFTTADVYSIGQSIVVRSDTVVSDVTDFVRLEPLIQSPRPILLAKVYTAQNTCLGKVRDIQFQTSTFVCTWLHVHTFFKKTTVSTSSIKLVTNKGIYLHDTTLPEANSKSVTEELTEALQVEVPVPATSFIAKD